MMNKNFCILFFLISAVISSQTLFIMDEYGMPVSEAVVELKKSQKFFFANQEGELQLGEDFKDETIEVLHEHYENAKYDWNTLEQEDFKIYLYKCNFTLNEVIVSASRLPERKSTASPQIDIINTQDIKLGNAPTTAEILSNSAEVFVQKSQLGGGSPNLRGFEANKILLMVDGVRLNNAIFRSGHLQNIINTNPNFIKQVEILYGAGAVTFGSDALGGVINISSKSPSTVSEKRELKGQIFGRYGSAANEKTIQTNIEYSKEKWASLSSFNYSFFDDLRQGAKRSKAMGELGLRPFYAINNGQEDLMIENHNPNIQIQSGYKQYNFNQKFLYSPNNKDRHLVNIHWSSTSDVPRYDRLSEILDNGNQKYADWYYGPQKWFMGSYNYQKLMRSNWADQLNVIASYQQFGESRHKRLFGDSWQKNQIEKVDALTFTFDLQKQIKSTSLKYGIDSYYNKVKSKADQKNIYTEERSDYLTRYPDGGSIMGSVAAYLKLQTELFPDKIYLSEGFRFTYTHLNSTFDDQTFFPFPYNSIIQNTHNLSAFLGMVFKPQKNLRLAFNANSGFRTPNVDDLAKVFDSSPGFLIVPSSDLKTEKTIGVDFLLSAILWNTLKFEGAAYYTTFRDIITLQNGEYQGNTEIEYEGITSQILQSTNAGKANIYGWNIGIEAVVTGDLRLKGKYTFTHGRVIDEEDYPLDHIPPSYGKINAEYQKKKWLISAYSIFNMKKDIKDYSPFGEDNEKYATENGMPAWVTFNLKTSYSWKKNLSLNLGVENILDTNYRVFASGISAPGRNFIASINYIF